MKVLVVEDEAAIAEDLCNSLVKAGYLAEMAIDGEDGWWKGSTNEYDAVVLDLTLPKIDGLTILRRWREEGHQMPVIILSARSAWTERVEGIDIGADDYLTKPFEVEELLARLRALMRRSIGQAKQGIEIGRLRLDTKTKQLLAGGRFVPLTVLEHRLVSYFMHNAGTVLSAYDLMEHIYGSDHDRNENAIEALIARVRRKLGVDQIKTMRGQGYVLELPGE